MADRKVIAPMLVESGGEHPKNVTHSDVEAALMISRIKNECPNPKIDGIMRVYYTLKAVPLDGGRFFLVDGITGSIDSFVLGLVDLKIPIVEKMSSGAAEPEAMREVLKANADAFLDYGNREVLTFRGLVDSSFKDGIQNWAVHGNYDATSASLFLPDIIHSENPDNLLKTLKGLENAFDSQVEGCTRTASTFKETLQKLESRVMDNISSISLSPSMEDQKKKLLDRIKALGDERDRKIGEASDKVRSIKANLDVKLREHLEKVESLSQELRASDTQVKQLTEEEEYALEALRTEERRLETLEDQILETTRKLREIELKKSVETRKDLQDFRASQKQDTSQEEQKNTETSGDPSNGLTTIVEDGSGQAQVEKLEQKLNGDLFAEKLRQQDRSIEELSLEVSRLSFMLPQVRSRVNELKSSHNEAQTRLTNAKEQMERVQKALTQATSQKVIANAQEAAMLQAMKDAITHVSSEYQSKIDTVLKQVSLIEIGLKEQEFEYLTLRRELEYRIDALSARLDKLGKQNKETTMKLFSDSIIVLPALETEPFQIALPVYIIFGRENTPRFKILLPAYVSKLSSADVREKLIEKNIKNRLMRKLIGSRVGNRLIGRLLNFSGSSTLSFIEPEGFAKVEEKLSKLLERDVDLLNWVMSTLPSTDLLSQNDFFDNVNSGLQKLQTDGTLSKAEVSELRNWALEISAA